MSRFSDEWAAAASNIDDCFGADFLFHPMAQVGGRLVADPDRAQVALVAALTESAQLFDPIGERNASGMSKGVASQHGASEAQIDVAAAALPYRARAKDRFIRVSDGAVYEVSGVLEDGLARVKLRVVRLGVQ